MEGADESTELPAASLIWIIVYLVFELWLVVVDVIELDGDDGVAKPLILTLDSGAGSNLDKKIWKTN